ncbi:helix-turn-helix domain-containing protein [Streptomyces sp. HGB0020]|uniref:helix-turn-helix domain-containing protein n=1 Tax=Streptomyces sp. HGB0020 TaxID=1078086 RepID=UPI003B634B8C
MGEAAALLGCSPEYVRRLARTGHLRAHRVGEHGPWLTTPADLDAYRYGRQEATHGVAGPTPAERAKDRG